MFRMVQIPKTLVFLCMLIGWSQAFLHSDIINENEANKDADRVTDFTPPVCSVVNETSDCLLSCGNTIMEVTYMMTDGAGSGISYTSLYSVLAGVFSNFTQYDGLDEDGYKAVFLHYSGICCLEDVNVSVVDKAGNTGKCPVVVKRVNPVTLILP
ncbi:hypothetical protein ABG768_006519 [Culter alburnus]|uniref:Uncharacterized protein n=1 Tax=Culter alburnus TaxID=194366 RepID=A0AAW1ZQN3_CULAL